MSSGWCPDRRSPSAAPTNQIVLKDERCSRNHLEIFVSAGEWTLRDLDSRNGTLVGDQRVRGRPDPKARRHHSHRPLATGFRSSLGRGLFRREFRAAAAGGHQEKAPAADEDDSSSVLASCGPTTITHRRGQTRFLEPGEEDVSGMAKIGRAAAKLCRLAFELAKAPDTASMAELALAGLARRHANRRRGGALVAPRLPRRAAGRSPGSRGLAQLDRSPLPADRHTPGRHRDARRRSSPGPKRDGRQHPGQPRQQGRNPYHQRALRPGAPRPQDSGTHPFVFHRCRPRPRSRRAGVHVGGGRHRGRGPGESQAPPGIGGKPHPSPHRKRGTARAAGRAKPHDRQQRGHQAGDRPDHPRRRQQRHRAHSRRERRGQGVGRPGRPLFQPPPRSRVRLPELCGPVGRAAGQRVVRPRARRLHRGHGAEDRQVRSRPPGAP